MKEHEKDIKVFKDQAEQGTDPEIKALAEKGAQILAEHLTMAKELDKRLQS